MRICLSLLAACCLFALTGCEGGKQVVSGTVQFEGAPVAEGDMIFEPENKSVTPEGAKIKDGKYTANLPKGKYKVRITANRTDPSKKGPMGEDFVEQFIPKKYNSESTLSAEVTSDKKPIDFDLKK